jgi:hypothetical protein
MKFPAFYGTQRFIIVFTNAHHPTFCCSNSEIKEAVGYIFRIERESLRKRTLGGGGGGGGESRLIRRWVSKDLFVRM